MDAGSLTEHITMIITVLFAISEGLALVPAVKSNSIFQLVYNILKTLAANKDEEK